MTNEKYNILIQGEPSKKKILNEELEVVPTVFYFRSKADGINNSAKVGTSIIRASEVEYNQKWYHEKDVLCKTHNLCENWNFFHHYKTMQILKKLPIIDDQILTCADQIAKYKTIFKMEQTPFGFSHIQDRDKLNWVVDYLGQEKINEIYDSLPKNLDSIINKIKEFDSNTRENVFRNWYEDMGHHIFCEITEQGKKIELTRTVNECIKAYQTQDKMYNQAIKVRDEKRKDHSLKTKIFETGARLEITKIKRERDLYAKTEIPIPEKGIGRKSLFNPFGLTEKESLFLMKEEEKKKEKKLEEYDSQIKDLESKINSLKNKNIDLE